MTLKILRPGVDDVIAFLTVTLHRSDLRLQFSDIAHQVLNANYNCSNLCIEVVIDSWITPDELVVAKPEDALFDAFDLLRVEFGRYNARLIARLSASPDVTWVKYCKDKCLIQAVKTTRERLLPHRERNALAQKERALQERTNRSHYQPGAGAYAVQDFEYLQWYLSLQDPKRIAARKVSEVDKSAPKASEAVALAA